MRKKQWYFLSIVIASLATLLVAGRTGSAKEISIPAEGICCKSKVKDCIRKEKENPMILESMSRQFIFILR